LSPYFIWKTLAEKKPITEFQLIFSILILFSSFTVFTKDGKEPLADYIRRKLIERPQIDYSIIVPAFNEAKRLPNLLPKAIEVFRLFSFITID